jgi:hypothetical protein
VAFRAFGLPGRVLQGVRKSVAAQRRPAASRPPARAGLFRAKNVCAALDVAQLRRGSASESKRVGGGECRAEISRPYFYLNVPGRPALDRCVGHRLSRALSRIGGSGGDFSPLLLPQRSWTTRSRPLCGARFVPRFVPHRRVGQVQEKSCGSSSSSSSPATRRRTRSAETTTRKLCSFEGSSAAAREASDWCNAVLRARRPLGQLQLRILKDARSHLSHRVEQAARLQRLAVLRL